MEIYRNVARDGTLRPRAENLIRGIPTAFLHHAQHGLKHPLSTYQTSLGRIETAWHKVLPLLDKLYVEVMCKVELKHYTPMLDAYEALLYRLNEHIDAAHEVLRCLRPPLSTSKEFRTHAEFLWATKLPGFKTFKDTVHQGYRDRHVGVIVNEMKHASAQLRAICGRTESQIIVGFFLDGVRGGEAIGPNRKLHAPHGRWDTAFSFSRDMLMHFWWVYQISEALCRCIEATIRADHDTAVHDVPLQSDTTEWGKLCLACSRIKTAFFPDECTKPYPLIVCPPDATSVRLQFPTPRQAIAPKSLEISMLLKVAEQSRIFVMPYFQKTSDQHGTPS